MRAHCPLRVLLACYRTPWLASRFFLFRHRPRPARGRCAGPAVTHWTSAVGRGACPGLARRAHQSRIPRLPVGARPTRARPVPGQAARSGRASTGARAETITVRTAKARHALAQRSWASGSPGASRRSVRLGVPATLQGRPADLRRTRERSPNRNVPSGAPPAHHSRAGEIGASRCPGCRGRSARTRNLKRQRRGHLPAGGALPGSGFDSPSSAASCCWSI